MSYAQVNQKKATMLKIELKTLILNSVINTNAEAIKKQVKHGGRRFLQKQLRASSS